MRQFTDTPSCRSISAMNMTSARLGTFVRCSGASVKRLAAISGSAAFFAPLIGTAPRSRRPPTTRMRSIVPRVLRRRRGATLQAWRCIAASSLTGTASSKSGRSSLVNDASVENGATRAYSRRLSASSLVFP